MRCKLSATSGACGNILTMIENNTNIQYILTIEFEKLKISIIFKK